MLLPHGYEGQGAEHSSARIERFLQLCALNNMVVVCPSTPAQMFHLLRRQMLQSFRKPLVVFTPKSLLRHPVCISTVADLSNGNFQTCIVNSGDLAAARQVLFCCGKIFYELEQERIRQRRSDTVIIRIEQLYPLDIDALRSIIDKCGAECRLFWVQEEPANMGVWQYIRQAFVDLSAHVGYIGRSADSCPAVGSHHLHEGQQANIIKTSFSIYDTKALPD
jgi:2-oxoglutarate dehydrogenase E1 component